MNRMDRVLVKIYLAGLPPLALLAVLSKVFDVGAVQAAGFLTAIYDLFGLMLAVWLALTTYLGLRLLFSEEVRETVLSKLTFIKERDEREVMLTGRATRNTMLITLAVLMFILFLSCFQFSVYSLPPAQAVEGKTRVVELGLQFRLLDTADTEAAAGAAKLNGISYSGLPVSNSILILGLIAGQIAAYNYSMRRLMK